MTMADFQKNWNAKNKEKITKTKIKKEKITKIKIKKENKIKFIFF